MISKAPARWQLGVLERHPKLAVATAFIIALLLCAWINGLWFWLSQLPRSGAEDLAKHVALALNFREALAAGEFLPRLQTSGTVLQDMPVFQYYGFFEGLAAWPFLKLGLGGLRAVTVAIVLLRWGAFATVYATGRVMRAGPAACALAGFAYVLSPYLINNELCRVAVAEVHAHNLLPLSLLGWALILRGQRALGVVVSAFGLAALGFTHNIFFLYTAVLLGILFLFSLPDWRAALALALGGVGGVLLAGVQWYPTILSQGDIMLNFLDRGVPFQLASLVSLAGLWGSLKPYLTVVPSGSIAYYFTFAWWTLPAVVGLLWAIRRDPAQRPTFVALLAADVVFFLLIVPPMDFWAVLPAPFAAVQFTYRLIAYVALISALGLAVAFPGLSWTALLGLLPLMVLSQWSVIHTDTLGLGRLALSDAQIASSYGNYDYACASPPKSLPSNLCYGDGMLIEDNNFYLHPTPKLGSKSTLLLAGYNESPGVQTIRLVSLLGRPPMESPVPALAAVAVPPGTFSVELPLDTKFPSQRIIGEPADHSSPTKSDVPRSPAVRFRSALQSEDSSALLLPVECLEAGARQGYKRTFRLLPTELLCFGMMGGLRYGDGWLREDNIINTSLQTLRLKGANGIDRVVRLFAAKLGQPEMPLTRVVEIPPGPFDFSLALAGLPLPLRLYYSPFIVPHEVAPASSDLRKLALMLSDDGAELNRTYSSFVVQTPCAYNRFWEASHDGKPVPTFSDVSYHLCVSLKQPTGTVIIRYRVPRLSWVLSIVGLALCGTQPWLWKKITSQPPRPEHAE